MPDAELSTRVAVLEERDKFQSRAVEEISKSLVELRKELPIKIAEAISAELKPVLLELSAGEKKMIKIGEELRDKPDRIDCDVRGELCSEIARREHTLEERLEPYMFVHNHWKISIFAVIGFLYAASHEWIGRFLIELVKYSK